MRTSSPDVTAAMAEMLGAHRVTTDPADLARHAGDRSPLSLLDRRDGHVSGLPLCVVRPRTTEQVAEVLAWADDRTVPVVPYGGGSGVCGAIAAADAIVLDLRALNEIVDFDEKSRLVRVQAGMCGPDLAAALADWGYMLGHEPQSLGISTVGGWLATRATGQLSARYGGIEDMVAGMEAVLPGGRIATTKPVPRRAVGPDVAWLLLGSEGTLGVITEATLRVSPIPLERADRCVRFTHMAEGVRGCRAIAQSDLRPTVVRLYDEDDATIFLRHFPSHVPVPLLLLSFDGHDADGRADAAVALSGGEPGDDGLVAHWWEHRNDAVDEYKVLMAGEGVLGPHAVVDTIEVSATWSRLRDLYHSLKDALTPLADIAGCHLSHVYPDGACLYFTLASASPDDAKARETHATWWETAMTTCLAAGGSISHHHGIGRIKARWLPAELNGWWEALVAIKSALDPKGIMNPGALGL